MAYSISESSSPAHHVDGVLSYLADRNEKPMSYTYQRIEARTIAFFAQ